MARARVENGAAAHQAAMTTAGLGMSVGDRIEQTFDAIHAQTSFGVEKLTAQYVFACDVNRIFGDQGSANRRDFGTRSHLMNWAYQAAPELKAVVFAYVVDSNDPSASFGSNTFGTRLTRSIQVSDSVSISYQASYAFQQSAARNAVDFDGHYYIVETGPWVAKVGRIAVGYEVLGTDQGKGRIVTPYATAHSSMVSPTCS